MKKGKAKASVPAASQASSASKNANKGSKNNDPNGNTLKEEKKPKAGSAAQEAAPVVPPKPTVKQIIGGSSWTGKLPVNLLSEYCQKQKWERPAYDTRKTADGFSVWITLSARDAKTQQLTTLDAFKITPTHKHLLLRETALEAKHAAATYALFRVCSMQNKHTVLPPDYKSLWKEFQALKTQDVKDGKAWMYEADPFKALQERQEAKAAMEKKRSEMEKAKAKAKEMPGASGLVLLSAAGASSSDGLSRAMKGWTTVPKVEMGRRTRMQLEALLRKGVSWNPHGVSMTEGERGGIISELSRLGFRQSHVAEAVGYCKDRQETLEWLLIHVPEDDLPRWALPENYSAGVTIGTTDLKREGIIKRLSQTGYSLELCTRILAENNGDEDVAAEALQNILVPSMAEQEASEESLDFLDMGSAQEQWEEEAAALESIYDTSFRREGDRTIQIQLESVANSSQQQQGPVEAFLQVRRGSSYPRHLILAIVANLPSYIKLSIIKQALAYIEESLRDEPMKIYLVMDWVQQNINSIIEHPGKLLDISAVSSAASETQPTASIGKQKRTRAPPTPIRWKADARGREEWVRRQNSTCLKDMVSKRQRLPAWQMRDDIVRTVEENHVTIISGETGSGKSTQSVQFILDDLHEKGLGGCAKMIVTQPRRISALGLAERVAEERCCKVGGEVGYAIRGESRQGKETSITFVTTGVLLRRLQTSGGRVDDVVASLADVSHVVIDEVHERSLDTDFLLNLIREVMIRKRDALKLVLMSATLDAATFEAYFASEGLSVGSVEIPGRTFPVEEYYLDDIVRMTGFGAERSDDKYLADESVGKIIQKLGARINYNLLAEVVRAVDDELSYEKKAGAILIFLPGVGEINQACSSLRAVASLHVLPLHASLETREQKRVFGRPPAGKRKVVVATNVAETSITIDDIVAVVDSGKVKETGFDAANNMRRLEERWASLAACRQRQGRAGRVQAGRCYKLFTRKLAEEGMAARPEPEIRRVPLEQLCLSVRAMGVRDVAGFLARSPTAPETAAVEGAMALLRRMGALDGDELTAMGEQLAMLPTDLRCGKLMVFGAVFGCLDECVTIAAILSVRSPFVAPQERREEARAARMAFSSAGDGDLMTDLAAYARWEEVREGGGGYRETRAFCDEHYLSVQTLMDIANTRTQYYEALREMGLTTTTTTTTSNGRNTSPLLLRALIASAFTPQIARIQFPDKKFASSMSGAVELDPEARSIKYFCQEPGRVFVHPSSTLFGSQGFSGGAAYMSYFSMISTSKIFIRDLTPFNAYTLLMFSGPIELDTLGRGLLVDGWLRLRGWARLGVLVARLRAVVDGLIADKVENPGLDVAGHEVVRFVVRMIELDGMDD